ncbi:neuropeptide CCHamide-2 receptor-like [Onthophagus taurus]|uniref:neuropeptide CCHamide-2 receptor-like n=1 Tax=Onthophagus taurus TaxID=166361 RepID=UPI000C2029AE|nr:neuropeptide CCHamide-2 receptor-like [Onthophagus taurus]
MDDETQHEIDDKYTPYVERPETYVVPVLFFMIFVVGVLGNGTLVVIFVRHRTMRNIPNTYILSLAMADLLLILTCVPFTSIIYTFESWPWGITLCKISEIVKDVSTGVSVFTLTALSAERYCAIVNPLRRLQTKPLTVFSALIIWLIAILLSIPDGIFSELQENKTAENESIVFCTPFPDNRTTSEYRKYNVATKALIYYLIPLWIIAMFYISMAKRLQASANEIPGELQGQSVSQMKARKHVARMVLCFVFLFFICFLPYHVFFIWYFFNPNMEEDYDSFWHCVKIIGFCMSFINSCVNPVALYCVSGLFRQYFNMYLFCKPFRRLRRTLPSSMENCETSFNSTFRKPLQHTITETQSIHRNMGILFRQNTQDIPVMGVVKNL